MSAAGTRLVSFKFGDKFKKIAVTPSHEYDAIVRQVAEALGVEAVEIEYEDPADGQIYILSAEEDMSEAFSQNYRWQVADISATTAPSVTSARFPEAGTSGQGDEFNHEGIPPERGMWSTAVPENWECKGGIRNHPFFISYNRLNDRLEAKEVFYALKVAQARDTARAALPAGTQIVVEHPFLDIMCVPGGKKWGVHHMSAIFYSDVVILLCSAEALEKMATADREPYNVLLEWELALQMHEEKGHAILPIFLSSYVNATLPNGRKSRLIMQFRNFDHTQFPNKFHNHPLSPRRHSVSETVKKIFEFNGPSVNRGVDISKIVVESRTVHNQRKGALNSAAPSNMTLSRSNLLVLEAWLSPLSVQMEDERDALLRNFLPGTRDWLVRKVLEFLSPDDPASTNPNRVMWLRGVAGVGKSVMAAVVSRELQALHLLGGLFFCKHDDEQRSSARNLVLTIAYGLAKFSSDFGDILLRVKQEHPEILSRSVFEMMNVLIAQPLSRVVESKKLVKPVVLIVDAIDECGVIHKRDEILFIFRALNQRLPANVKILVSGRPEEDIVSAFEDLQTESIEPTAEENIQDQVLFARNFLESSSVDASIAERALDILIEKSGGVFVWLVASCKYLRNSGSQVITLDQILELPEGDKLDGSIDRMYDRIFSGICDSIASPVVLDVLLRTLALIVLAHEPLSASGLVSLLANDEPATVMSCIRLLEPVLVLDATSKKIRVFHKSVRDYLSDSTRCRLPKFQIDWTAMHSMFASLCITALNSSLKFNICSLPFAFHSEIADFTLKVEKGIPEHVKYAVKHFWKHTFDSSDENAAVDYDVDEDHPPAVSEIEKRKGRKGPFKGLQKLKFWAPHPRKETQAAVAAEAEVPAIPPAIAQMVEKNDLPTQRRIHPDLRRSLYSFLFSHGHHYLEASSLLGSLDAVIPAMTSLLSLAGPAGSTKQYERAQTLMQDMKRVVQAFSVPLNAYALQVYLSAAPFSPAETEFHKCFAGQVPHGIPIPRAVKGLAKHWPACITVFDGHTDRVNSVKFSPDGQLLVSAGTDKSVRIWNVSNGRELLKLEGHTGIVSSAIFSPDGKLVFSSSRDNTARIWNALTGEELHVLRGHRGAVIDISPGPDGRLAVTGSEDRTVRIWSVSTGTEIQCMMGNGMSVTSVKFSPDGSQVLSGGVDHSVRVWDVSTGKQIGQLESHPGTIRSASFSPDGQTIISTCNDKFIRIWDISSIAIRRDLLPADKVSDTTAMANFMFNKKTDTSEELIKLVGHSESGITARFSPDGRFVVSAGSDKSVRIWDALSGEELHVINGFSEGIRAFEFSPNGELRLLASTGNDNIIRIWNPFASHEQISPGQELHSKAVNSVAFSPNRKVVVSCGEDKTAKLWNSDSTQLMATLKSDTWAPKRAILSPDGSILVTEGDFEAKIWNTSTGKILHVLPNHSTGVACTSFSADGRLLLSASRQSSSSMKIWNVSTWRVQSEFKGSDTVILSAALSTDARLVATGAIDRLIQVFSADSGLLQDQLVGHTAPVSSLCFSPNGKYLVSGTPDATVWIWDAKLFVPLRKFQEHIKAITMSGFSQNSNFVYSVDELGLTKVWEVSGKEKLPTSSMVEGRLPVSTKELKIVSSRNSSGKKLWHSEEFIEPRLTKAAWLTVAPTMLSFWLPAELRGDQQVVKDNTLLTFGEMLAGVIKLEIS